MQGRRADDRLLCGECSSGFHSFYDVEEYVRCISSVSRACADRAGRPDARGMQALAMALAAGDGNDSDGMSERDAVQLCTTLRSMASTICDSLTKRLQSQLGEPGGGDRSLDKSGEQVQAEALQLCCLMTGRGGDAEAGRKLVAQLEAHGAVPEVAAFLRYPQAG